MAKKNEPTPTLSSVTQELHGVIPETKKLHGALQRLASGEEIAEYAATVVGRRRLTNPLRDAQPCLENTLAAIEAIDDEALVPKTTAKVLRLRKQVQECLDAANAARAPRKLRKLVEAEDFEALEEWLENVEDVVDGLPAIYREVHHLASLGTAIPVKDPPKEPKVVDEAKRKKREDLVDWKVKLLDIMEQADDRLLRKSPAATQPDDTPDLHIREEDEHLARGLRMLDKLRSVKKAKRLSRSDPFGIIVAPILIISGGFPRDAKAWLRTQGVRFKRMAGYQVVNGLRLLGVRQDVYDEAGETFDAWEEALEALGYGHLVPVSPTQIGAHTYSLLLPHHLALRTFDLDWSIPR
jgi:hypothetical protein